VAGPLEFAALRLVRLLAERDRIDELEVEVAAGTLGASEKLQAVRSPHHQTRQTGNSAARTKFGGEPASGRQPAPARKNIVSCGTGELVTA
jgi:hypothetical protein